MKLTCVLDSMAGGGAERVMTHLAGGLARRGHRVAITTLDPSAPDFYPAPAGVSRSAVDGVRGGCRWYQLKCQRDRVLGLRRRITEQAPDAVIAFVDVTNILTLAACRGSGIPVVACEHINPLRYRLPLHWAILRKLLYPSAACVVMLTEDTLDWARNTAGARAAVAIPDPVPVPVFSADSRRPGILGKGKNLLAMGRLIEQKGFDILLPAFAGIAGRFPDWQLTILGEGPERGRLEGLRDELGLAGRAVLPGARPDAYDVLKHSDLFVLSSRFEGFGMALAEALSCGVPAVSFDCPSGPALILRHGVDGLLVPPGDGKALALALAELMSDEEKRKTFAEKAPEVAERFGVEAYLDRWEELLAGLQGRAL